MSEEADPLYQPLGGLEGWADAVFDETAWTEAVDRLQRARHEDPDWGAMVERSMLLAAAYQSAGLDGLYAVDADIVRSLLLGDATLGSIDEAARAHVRANYDALQLARHVEVTEESIRRIHDVACRPQLTHPVRVDDRVQDHVLAAGAYKHHPNHILAAGRWRATAPVAQVASEMASLVANVGSPLFAQLHPVVQAAYFLHALDHIQPFADGNGRVGRALASGCLLRAAGIPQLTLDGPPSALVDLLTSAPRESPALARWLAQEAAGTAMRRRLAPAVAEALERYLERPDRRVDLSEAVVITQETGVTVRVPVPPIEEIITVEAHREEGEGPPLLTAVEAGLRLEAAPGADLVGWLDRVVPILALRVAAELE